MKNIFVVAVAVLSMICLLSCGKRLSEDQKKAVYDKTVQDLVFVKGGSFMMGDGIATFTAGGIKFKSYWTGDRDDKPTHKVTLHSYSMMKYEVTYNDYDFFCKATERELIEIGALDKKRRGPKHPVWGVP